MSHDYDPAWDYELDPLPPPTITTLVDQARRAHGRLWRQLGFTKVTFAYVCGLRGHLARYVSGTRDEPVFVLDAHAIGASAKRHRVDLKTAVWSTLLHEYGHAYVEVMAVVLAPRTEEQLVERFAHTAWEDDWKTTYALQELNTALGL